MKLLKRRAGSYVPVLLTVMVMGIIFLFSSQRAEQSNAVSVFVTERIVKLLPQTRELEAAEQEKLVKKWNSRVRKYAHITIFFVLGMTVCVWLLRRGINWKRYVAVLFICFLYAVSDELHQMFVGGRGPMIKDVGIDFLGSMLGSGAGAAVIELQKHIRKISL